MRQIAISLVVTTYNRAALLSMALESIAGSRDVLEAAAVEILVIDNNSTDDTRDVVAAWSERDDFRFELRYVLEPQQGLSYARNRGTAESNGRIIAFMDDDQRLDELFIARLTKEFDATQADCLGGPLFYYNAQNLPDWLTPLTENAGQFDLGPEVKTLGPEDRMLIGGNMAFRRSILEQAGGYNVSLGRQGASLLAGEEYDLQERLLAQGRRIVYTPNLVQYHYLRPVRLKKRYWRRHIFDYGRTLYRQERLAGKHQTDAFFVGCPQWFWSSLISRELPSAIKSLTQSESARLHRQLDVCFRLGQIYEARRTTKAQDKQTGRIR